MWWGVGGNQVAPKILVIFSKNFAKFGQIFAQIWPDFASAC
jgi:hypothetical protein